MYDLKGYNSATSSAAKQNGLRYLYDAKDLNMVIPPIALKRNSHRLLLCTDAKKQDLLAKLLFENEGKRIAVVVSDDTEKMYVPEGITLLFDDTPSQERFELLISYDLPDEPEQYLARLALAGESALTLMGESDHPQLLGIETLLGRSIVQESPSGFAPAVKPQPKQHPKRHGKPGVTAKKAVNDEPKHTTKPKSTTPPKRTPKASGISRYLGKDENGKPIFSGKTGERNHQKNGKPHTKESQTEKQEWEAKRKKNGPKKPTPGADKSAAKGAKTDRPAATPSKPKRPIRRIKADALKKSEPKA